MVERLGRALKYVYERLLLYAVKFGVVGLIGYVIDVGIFNFLRLGFFGSDHFWQGPLGAKIISVTIATLATWFGNRYWTFREDRRQHFMVELLEFSAIAAVGMGISLLFLFVSHYVLGYTSLVADNISTNVIGLFFATAFRFLLYRYWVYGHNRADGLAAIARREAAARKMAEASSEAASFER